MDKKTEVKGIYKTPEGALINKDYHALAAYKAQKKKIRKIKHLEEQIDSLRSDITEIKKLLINLVGQT